MPAFTRRPEQLRMFMSAQEITDRFQVNEWDRDDVPVVAVGAVPRRLGTRPETSDEAMERKRVEVKAGWAGPNFSKSIATEGVKKPVHLSHQFSPVSQREEIAEGHHRIAATMAINPERLMPVMHHESTDAVGEWIMENE